MALSKKKQKKSKKKKIKINSPNNKLTKQNYKFNPYFMILTLVVLLIA